MSSQAKSEIHALMAKHQGAIRGYILSLTADPHVTNDVLQEANLVITKKSDSYQIGTNFIGWACKIAYFEVLRYRTNNKREKLVFDDALLETIAEEAGAECELYAARKEALSHCLRQLSERNKQLILQRYFEGIPLVHIAESRNSTANAISQLLYRLRQQLIRCIENTQVDNKKW